MNNTEEKRLEIAKAFVQKDCMSTAAVLVVEDDLDRLRAVIKSLPAERYVGIGLNSSRQADDYLKQMNVHPQAAVVDCVLQRGGGDIADNGITAVETIQSSIGGGYKFPVFLYSSIGKAGMDVYKKKAEEARLDVRGYFHTGTNGGDLTPFLKEILRALDEQVYMPRIERLTKQFAEFFERSIGQLQGDLQLYRQILGEVNQLPAPRSYQGEVISYRPPHGDEDLGEGRIQFEGQDYKFAWTFPGDKIRAVNADFLGAKIQYDVYMAGPTSVATLRCMNSEVAQPLVEGVVKMSQKELEELSR